MTGCKKPNRADMLTFHALQKAVEADKLRVYLDYGKVNRPLSPIYNPWECLLPILIPIFISLILIVAVGIVFGLLFMAGMILIYSGVVKKKLYQRLVQRAKDHMLSGYENCCALWAFGGIILVNRDNKKSGCVAPEGDWKEFVVRNYADFMLDNSEEKQDEKIADANTAA